MSAKLDTIRIKSRMANNDLKTEFMFEWSKHFGYGTMISVLKKRRVVKETMQINTFRLLVSIY